MGKTEDGQVVEVQGEDEKGFEESLGLNNPTIETGPAKDPDPEPKPDSEPDPEPDPEPKPDSEPEPEPKPDSEPEPEDFPEKDLTKEEIDKLPKDAKGLYYALKAERGKRKSSEAETDFLKLQNKYRPKAPDKKPDKDPEPEVDEIAEILKDKADDDILSAGDLKKIIAAQDAKKVKDAKKAESIKDEAAEKHTTEVKRMDDLEDVFKKTVPDYEEVLNIFAQAVKDIPSLQLEIIAEAKRDGGNPAARAYELGNKFKGSYGKATKLGKTGDGKPKSKEEIKRILKNAAKKTPSATIPGANISVDALEELEADELGKTLQAMSMAQFMRVPKKLREKALR